MEFDNGKKRRKEGRIERAAAYEEKGCHGKGFRVTNMDMFEWLIIKVVSTGTLLRARRHQRGPGSRREMAGTN